MIKRFGWRGLSGVAMGLVVLGFVAQPWRPEAPPAPISLISPGRRAPEFPSALEWVNVAQPVRLSALRGKVVLLNFWASGNLNCQHLIPELLTVARRYPNELVVIGVHCAKFDTERRLHHLRRHLQQFDIRYPVVNDPQFQIWQAYGVTAWPTCVLVSPDGRMAGGLAGEGRGAELEMIIRSLIDHPDRPIDRRPSPRVEDPTPRATVADASPLKFPGTVLAYDGELVISDSGHHRLVVTDLAGTIRTVIGSGAVGHDDGPVGAATFHTPRGVARDGPLLYIADTGNHLIRLADLRTGQVRTLAGTGEQGFVRRLGGPALAVPLNSPWDLVKVGPRLFITMAGTHQIWSLDLTLGILQPFAGSGLADLIDGPAAEAAFAQPSGLASDGAGHLLVADSQVSAVREVDVTTGAVRTLVGAGPFDFGDQDGPWEEARLQQPLGVACASGRVYVADTYNHRIKALDRSSGLVLAQWGTGEADARDGTGTEAACDEPGGISIAHGTLYIADTNNHRIRAADLATGVVTTLPLQASAAALAGQEGGRGRGHLADEDPHLGM